VRLAVVHPTAFVTSVAAGSHIAMHWQPTLTSAFRKHRLRDILEYGSKSSRSCLSSAVAVFIGAGVFSLPQSLSNLVRSDLRCT
jgi:hypothetical protein